MSIHLTKPGTSCASTQQQRFALHPRPWHPLCSALALSLISAGVLAAPVPFTQSYSQDFNTLPASGSGNLTWENDKTLPGWHLFNKDNAAITQYMVGDGSANTGKFYSFGADTDRALGALISTNAYFGTPAAGNGQTAGWIALAMQNQSNAAIDALALKFSGEQWRFGGSANAQWMTLEYGYGDSFDTVSTWLAAGDNFNWSVAGGTGSAVAVNGNTDGKRPNLGGDLRNLQWAPGQTLWLRWAQNRITVGGSNNAMAIDDVVITKAGADTTPPALLSSVPANNASGVATISNVTLQFSEALKAGSGSFELRKGGSVVATFDVTDSSKVQISSQNVTIKPGFELDANTAYTLAALGSPLLDLAGNAWVGTALSFTTGAAAPITRISSIQGSGDASPLLGQSVTINAVVTAYMPGLSGFYVQEEEGNYDADPGTSEGVLVYYGASNPGVDESTVGKRVKLTAVVDEFNQLTELKNISNFQIQGAGQLPKPVQLTLPIADMALWERYEGMLVEITSASGSGGKLVVTDSYTLGRYGDVTLSADKVLPQFTDEQAPDPDKYKAYVKATQRAQIILDDASSKQNPDAVRGRNGQPLSASNSLRAGDGVASVVGVLDQYYDAKAAPADYQTSYRVQPTQALNFTGADRPTASDVQAILGKANVKIASANVLNFFSKVGDTSTNTKDVFTTPLGNSIGIRGANTLDELDRQKAKVVANLIGLQADVYGLMEVQNNGFGSDSAIKLLTDAMNASADKPQGAVYAYVKAPFNQGDTTIAGAGTDAITVAMVYRSDKLTPVGAAAVPNVATYDAFTPNVGGARVPIAQTFSVPTAAGVEQFTLVVNHFKSKGSLLATGDNADKQDGQGNNNEARVKTAAQLSDWLATKPTGSDTANVVLVGDFNAYAKEDPVTYLESKGFAKVSQGYSYSFDGLWGSLDHIFVTPSLKSKVGKVVKWAINAEEPTVLDYNMEYKSADQIRNYYAATAYRSSDHNPIVMGLNFDAPPANLAPVIKGVPGDVTALTLGQGAALSGISVEDADSEQLVLTLDPVNGTVQGVTDADAQLAGIQIQGTAGQINAALAKASFVPVAEGGARVGLSLSDGVNAAVTASYALKVFAVIKPETGFELSAGEGTGAAVTGQLQGAGCKLAGQPRYVSAQSLGITTTPSAGAKLPHGLLVLNAAGCDKGGSLTVSMQYAQTLPEGAELWKWGRTQDNQTRHWYRVPSTVSGQTVSFELRDGGLGDDDLQADGNIADPSALVVPQSVTPPIQGKATPVPTLNAWGLLMLALGFLPFARRLVRKG